MVANLTIGKKGYEDAEEDMKRVAAEAQPLKDALLKAVDDDSRAFDGVMAAMKLPKKSDEDKQRRLEAIEAATKDAIEVPFTVIGNCLQAVELVEEVAGKGNKNSLSDAGVAALALEAGARGALFNVLINLPGISDETYKAETRRQASSANQEVSERCQAVLKKVNEELEQSLG
jgi:glutamate formiminotransferase/formiminotetrahydrofolate cyclodeaminase